MKYIRNGVIREEIQTDSGTILRTVRYYKSSPARSAARRQLMNQSNVAITFFPAPSDSIYGYGMIGEFHLSSKYT